MTWIQFLMALPVALLGVLLFQDFMAGLGEERLWGDPVADDPPAAVVIAPVEALPIMQSLKKAG